MFAKLHNALRLRTSPAVFFGSAMIILGFVIATLVATDLVDEFFGTASGWIMTNLGWFYVSGVTIFLGFLIWIAMSRYGHIRLGSDDERPEHSNFAWFGMLFAAGIGTILMFWGVAEPTSHFANPPMGDVEPLSDAAADEAIAFTLYHFGLHTWTIFTLPALAFAYFIYKRKLPPRVSSVFAPLLGRHIYGKPGAAIDTVAVVGTVFGIATSVGLGTLQINAGLNELFDIPENRLVQVLIIAFVTTIASISVALGLDRGIKRLSNLNIALAVFLLLFVVIAGPTLYLLKGTIESAGIYLKWLPELAFWNNTLPAEGREDWQNNWTVFYWAWTITWSPFVGIFIARISRGRTIREFVFGVLTFPVLFSIVWFGVFGMASFDIERNGSGGLVKRVVDDNDIPGALFTFLSNYPGTTFVAGLAIFIVVIFFTTSVDSAAMVLDMMSSGEEDTAPLHQRLYWATLMGVVAATLLAATGSGGLKALQEVITVIGLPFFILGYIMMFAITKAAKADIGYRGEPVTRQWHDAKYPAELEKQEQSPSPRPAIRTHYIPEDDVEPDPSKPEDGNGTTVP